MIMAGVNIFREVDLLEQGCRPLALETAVCDNPRRSGVSDVPSAMNISLILMF